MSTDMHSLLRHDAWLSEQTGHACFQVVPGTTDGPLQRQHLADALGKLAGAPHFLFAKVPSDDVRTARMLSQAGFYVVDTNVQLRKPPEAVDGGDAQGCRWAVPGDAEAVRAIADCSFVFSRFHLDPGFGKATADRLKAEWASGYFTGKRGDSMVVAESERGVAGFCLLIEKGDEVIIDLIAVAPECRRRGIARTMCLFAETRCKESGEMVVGTQVANTPSLNLYGDLGYRQVGSTYILHYHGGRQ